MEKVKFVSEELTAQLEMAFIYSEISDFQRFKDKYFIESTKQKKELLFKTINLFIEMLSFEYYIEVMEQIEEKLAKREKTRFLNIVLEPRFMSQQTEQVVQNRHKAVSLYEECSNNFEIVLEFEPENPFDENAIAVYLESKERLHLGYISKSFNLRIGDLLKKDAFPFIQANYEDILKEKYSPDNLVVDIYF